MLFIMTRESCENLHVGRALVAAKTREFSGGFFGGYGVCMHSNSRSCRNTYVPAILDPVDRLSWKDCCHRYGKCQRLQ